MHNIHRRIIIGWSLLTTYLLARNKKNAYSTHVVDKNIVWRRCYGGVHEIGQCMRYKIPRLGSTVRNPDAIYFWLVTSYLCTELLYCFYIKRNPGCWPHSYFISFRHGCERGVSWGNLFERERERERDRGRVCVFGDLQQMKEKKQRRSRGALEPLARLAIVCLFLPVCSVYCSPMAFSLICSRTPRCNFCSTLYPQSCWCIIQFILSVWSTYEIENNVFNII
jgi:hypothetical protein